MKKVKKFIHDKLGWGFPTTRQGGDSFQPTYHCAFCLYELARDSQGGWFHLYSDATEDKIELESYIKKIILGKRLTKKQLQRANILSERNAI